MVVADWSLRCAWLKQSIVMFQHQRISDEEGAKPVVEMAVAEWRAGWSKSPEDGVKVISLHDSMNEGLQTRYWG